MTPPFFGPRVVRAAFTMAMFGWGVGFYGPPVYLHAVIERTGWSLTGDAHAQRARDANGDTGRRHSVAHLERIHPDDIGRFDRFTGFVGSVDYPAGLQVTNPDAIKGLPFTGFYELVLNDDAGVTIDQ